MGTCRRCRRTGADIAAMIGFCAECLRADFAAAGPTLQRVHEDSRRAWGLPARPPRDPKGIGCPLCVQACRIPEGGRGYCGLRRVHQGKLRGGRAHEGNLSCYCDPLPTNCVADFVCPAGTGCGYPRHAHKPGPETGFKNLAVFYQACSFNCLYCQNDHFRSRSGQSMAFSARELAGRVDARTACICYFGGDPAPQVLHALATARLAGKGRGRGILRICWETNGAMGRPYLAAMAETALRSGGCIKIDLKAWHESIHLALCGVTNRRTLANFRWLAGRTAERPSPPPLIASTVLVPGYVDLAEVAPLARFIAALNPDIPYRLLAFYPHGYLDDLPTTSRYQAERCRAAAEAAGVRRVEVGNTHLLTAS